MLLEDLAVCDASAVVLVQKKDGSLNFYIDLCNLNPWTGKDAPVLPRIDEILDCFNVVHIFISLELKARYWQVETDEDSKLLTAFMVRPTVFCECECMPFRLMIVLAVFKQLLESCLSDLY